MNEQDRTQAALRRIDWRTILQAVAITAGMLLIAAGVHPLSHDQFNALIEGVREPLSRGGNVKLRLLLLSGGTASLLLAWCLFLFRGGIRQGLSILRDATLGLWQESRERLLAFFREENRWHLGALAAILFLALVVRAVFAFRGLEGDEAFTYAHFAGNSWRMTVASYFVPNNHVFHSVLMRVATLILGSDPWVLRIPAMVGGLLMVVAGYALFRRSHNPQIALCAAAVIAFSTYAIYYSTNARGYTLQGTLLLLVFLVLHYLLRARRFRPQLWIALVVATALGFWTIPSFFYGYGGAALWFLVSLAVEKDVPQRLRTFFVFLAVTVGAALTTLLLYLPITHFYGVELIINVQQAQPVDPERVPSMLWRAVKDLQQRWLTEFPPVLVWMSGWLAVFGVVLHWLVSRDRVPMFPFLVIWSLLVLWIQKVQPIPRAFFFFLPFYFVSILSGIAGLGALILKLGGRDFVFQYRHAFSLGAVCVLSGAILSAMASRDAVHKLDETGRAIGGREVYEFIQSRATPNDVVAGWSPVGELLDYYLVVHPGPIRRRLPWRGIVTDEAIARAETAWIIVKKTQSPPAHQVFEWCGVPPGRAERVLETTDLILFRHRPEGE